MSTIARPPSGRASKRLPAALDHRFEAIVFD